MIGEQCGDSQTQVRRYIRLTELIPEILSMVDSGRIALTPAVELSYLTRQEQRDLLETMESEDCTPSLSQAIQFKKLSQAGELDIDYAALKLMEILFERGFINYQTLQAAKEMVKDAPHISQAA